MRLETEVPNNLRHIYALTYIGPMSDGWKQLAVRDNIYEHIKTKAEAEDISMSEYLESMISRHHSGTLEGRAKISLVESMVRDIVTNLKIAYARYSWGKKNIGYRPRGTHQYPIKADLVMLGLQNKIETLASFAQINADEPPYFLANRDTPIKKAIDLLKLARASLDELGNLGVHSLSILSKRYMEDIDGYIEHIEKLTEGTK